MDSSRKQVSSSSGIDSAGAPEPLDLDGLPVPRTPEEAEALERASRRTTPMTLEEYARWVHSFDSWTPRPPRPEPPPPDARVRLDD